MILSQETGSRTIIFNPGNLEALTLNEFIPVLSNQNYSWIHFEARPHVEDMLKYLLKTNTKIKISLEIEKINMGYESLIELANVVFIGKDVSKGILF